MAELRGKKRKQPSSCPEGWLKAGLVIPIDLTARQENYAKRAVGTSRFVYNWLAAGSQNGRDAGLWLTPGDLEKEFNRVKHISPDLGFATQVSKFVAQGACRNFKNAYYRWRSSDLKSQKPAFRKKNRTGTGSFLAASGVDRVKYDGHKRVRLPYLGSVKLKRELPEGILYEVTIKKQNGRRLASVAYWKPPVTPPPRETCSACGVVNAKLKREPVWTCPNCGRGHDRNLNAARNLLKLALGAVGSDVMLPDGEALAEDCSAPCETFPEEGRTPWLTLVKPAVGWEVPA